MSDPLAPIAANQQHRRPHHNSQGSIKSFKSFATAETHPDDTTFAKDPTAPSSPFLYEAERSSRSPTKPPGSPSKSRGKSRSPAKVALNDTEQRIPLTEESLRANEFTLETPRSTTTQQARNAAAAGLSSASHRNYSPSESAFSAFSAIPNVDMTAFAKLSLSPSKTTTFRQQQQQQQQHEEFGPSSPTRSRPHTPGTARPNRSRDFDIPSSPIAEDGTTALIDFTEQFEMAARSNRSPTRSRNSPSKDSRDKQYQQQPRNAAGFKPATPGQIRELTNLLDFDLPPAPTPRSLPSITPRELESLKAGLMGQISSLKATISGKEAEISALKAASTDAENRVGEALEQLREVRNIKESLEQEKSEWERRDVETQRVLKEVRDQIHATDQERTQLEERLAESERRAEDAELRAQEADSKAAGTAAGEQSMLDDAAAADGADVAGSPANRAVQVAVEKVARELHALYKAKHETKVGQLKKSYEARWSKKTDALKADLDRLEKDLQDSRIETDGLRHELEEVKMRDGRVDAMTTVNPSKLAELREKETEIQRLQSEVDQLRLQVEQNKSEQPNEGANAAASSINAQIIPDVDTTALQSRISSLSAEVDSLKNKTQRLARELEASREENSALVATVDEFLAMDMDGATNAIVAPTVPLPLPSPAISDFPPQSVPSPIVPPSSSAPAVAGGSARPLSVASASALSSAAASISRPGSAMSARSRQGGDAGSAGASASAFGASGPSKPSGLKGPGFGFSQSRIGAPPSGIGMGVGGMKRSVSGAGAAAGSRSGIMSSIERMGRGRGAE